MSYLTFLRDFGGENEFSDVNSLRLCVPVKVEGVTQTLKRGVEGVYRGSELGSKANLDILSKRLDMNLQFLSQEYARAQQGSSWVRFFQMLHVPDVPAPTKISMKKENNDTISEAPETIVVDYSNPFEYLNVTLGRKVAPLLVQKK